MRFLADMGISPRCMEWLRGQGHDAVHLYEQKLHTLPDRDILEKARDEKRVLLTMDLDFAQLVSAAGTYTLPSVVIFRLSDQRPENVCKRLSALIHTMDHWPEHESAVISVTDEKVRVRRMPIR